MHNHSPPKKTPPQTHNQSDKSILFCDEVWQFFSVSATHNLFMYHIRSITSLLHDADYSSKSMPRETCIYL